MDYAYTSADVTWDDSLIWGRLSATLNLVSDKRCFEIGCGNGFIAERVSQLGFSVFGVDPSHTGIAAAKKAFPALNLEVGSAYDDLAAKFGTFPFVYSIEVVEHLVDPKGFAKRFYGLLQPGGLGFITTPYHGWLKNIAISVSGKWDSHHGVLWDGGHVKFFSRATLTELLTEAGFKNISIERVGRIPALAKSMIATFSR